MSYVFPGVFGSGGEKGGTAGDLGAGSFPLDKKGVPGIWCLREMPMEVLETGV